MGGQQAEQISRVDVERVTVPHYPGSLPVVGIRNTKAPPFIGHESVEGNSALRAEIKTDCVDILQHTSHFSALAKMNVLRNTANALVVGAVLLVTPFQRRIIQVGHVPEDPPRQKVVLHKSDEAFNLTLGKRVPGLA